MLSLFFLRMSFLFENEFLVSFGALHSLSVRLCDLFSWHTIFLHFITPPKKDTTTWLHHLLLTPSTPLFHTIIAIHCHSTFNSCGDRN